MTRDIFKEAIVRKLRFPKKGPSTSAEDLVTMPEAEFKALYNELIQQRQTMAVADPFKRNRTEQAGNETLELQIAVMDEIAAYRVEQEDARKNAAEDRKYAKLIDQIRAEKQMGALKDLDLAALNSMTPAKLREFMERGTLDAPAETTAGE